MRAQKLSFLEHFVFLNLASQFHVLPLSAVLVGRETLLWVNASAVSFSREKVMASHS